MSGFKKIGIIGMGLMGGSIFKKLKETGTDVVSGFEPGCDAVILAVPLSAVVDCAKELKAQGEAVVVIDIGSVKSGIAKEFEKLTDDNMEFVGTHPMAGKESSGFDHSSADLFAGAPWIVTPHAKNKKATLDKVEKLIRALGAHPLEMDADIHDKRAALISHLPYLISSALLNFVSETDPQALEMAGPGFKSMTRLAKDSAAMHSEIMRLNGSNIKSALEQYLHVLEKNL